MKWSFTVSTSEQIAEAIIAQAHEIIFSCNHFSRWSDGMDITDCQVFARQCQDKFIKPILLWDILPTEEFWRTHEVFLSTFDWSLFAAIRCQDYGVLHWIENNLPNMSIHWVAESAHQNLLALTTIETQLKERLTRLVLNLELPIEHVAKYVQHLKTPVELLGAGPLLLFYSPRQLLKAALKSDIDTKMCFADSEETPHKNFLIREQSHGTFMYHPKHYFNLDKIEEIVAAGVQYLRITLPGHENYSWLKSLSLVMQNASNQQGIDLKAVYPCDVMRGYFHHNRSNKLFVHLKNNNIQVADSSLVGQVVDVIKKQSMCVLMEEGAPEIFIGDTLEFYTPEGKYRTHTIRQMTDLRGRSIEHAMGGECILLEHLSGICVMTQVKRKSEKTHHPEIQTQTTMKEGPSLQELRSIT